MKSFFWQKISDMQIKPTIWKEIDDTGLKIQEDKLMELFGAAPPKEKDSGASNKPKEKEKPKVVELIDAGKAKGLAILLSRFKMSYHDIMVHIKQLDVDIFSDDQISGMKAHQPTKDEIEDNSNYMKLHNHLEKFLSLK